MNILLAESGGFSPRALDVLKSLGNVHPMNLAGTQLLHSLSNCDILWVRLRNYIGPDVLDAAPRLQWIVSPTTGLNHIDLEAVEKRGVRVLCLKGEVDFLKEIRATAELAVGLMIALMRRIPAAVRSVQDGVWNRDLFRGGELFERTVGLVGFGRLGRIMAGYLKAFGSKVMACDPALSEPDMEGVELVSLERLLRSSSMVSLHASYESGNRRFFDASCFGLMPQRAWLVNTARGELLDEQALLGALESGKLAGAALDVLDAETVLDLETHPLVAFARRSDRLILTPHLGGCTHESMERAEYFMAEKLKKALTCADSS